MLLRNHGWNGAHMCEAHLKFTHRYELLKLRAECSSEWGECWRINCFFSFVISHVWFKVDILVSIKMNTKLKYWTTRRSWFENKWRFRLKMRLKRPFIHVSEERWWIEWTCVFATSENLRGFLSRIVFVPTLFCYWHFPFILSFSRLSLFFLIFFITKLHVVHMTSTSQWQKKVIKHIEICFIRTALHFGFIRKQKQTKRFNKQTESKKKITWIFICRHQVYDLNNQSGRNLNITKFRQSLANKMRKNR